MIVRLTAGARRRAIASRGIHDQAALEKKRLQRAPDAQLCAELTDLPPAP